jgi:hypothetical protein
MNSFEPTDDSEGDHFVVFAQVEARAGGNGLGAFLVDENAKVSKVERLISDVTSF